MTYPQDPNNPYGRQQPHDPSGGFPQQPYGQPGGYQQQPYDPSGGYQQQPYDPSGGYQPYGQQYPSGGYPQQPGYPGAYPGAPMQPREGPGLAIGGLICSIAGFFLCFLIGIAGIVMGHIAYGKAKRGEAEGQGLAMAAFIVGYVGIALNIGLVVLLFGFGYAGAYFR